MHPLGLIDLVQEQYLSPPMSVCPVTTSSSAASTAGPCPHLIASTSIVIHDLSNVVVVAVEVA